MGTVGAHQAPSGCFWTRQVRHVLEWLLCFLSETEGKLSRTYVPSVYYGQVPDILIATDASTTGVGGILAKQGRICEYFHDELTAFEYSVLGQSASSSGQQAFECFAILLALRHWYSEWAERPVRLTTQSDN
eukprot:2636004-Amphidinium_carterae.1